METVNAIYKDGVLVLLDKVKPEDLASKKISVKIIDEKHYQKERVTQLKELYKLLHNSSSFSFIKDVVKWQRQIRADREILN